MRIPIKSTKGRRLFTKKTVIDENIEVVPNLENRTINANGTYTPSSGYAGIGQILVNVGSEGSWRGVYNPSVTYYTGNLVYSNGSVYQALGYVAAGVSPSNTGAWNKLTEVVTETGKIYTNGTHDVTNMKSIHVAVPDENNWEGVYEDGIEYKKDSLVIYQNQVFLCLADTDGTKKPTDEAYWTPISDVLDSPEWDGTGVVITTPMRTITFYIESNQMTAIEGMTWGDWCESHDTYTVDNQGRIFYETDGTYVADAGEIMVLATDTITEDGEYVYVTLVVEPIDALAGTWLLNKFPLNMDMFSGQDWSVMVNFTNGNGKAYSGIRQVFNPYDADTDTYYMDGSSWVRVGGDGIFVEADRLLTFTSNSVDITDGDKLVLWLQANATKQ